MDNNLITAIWVSVITAFLGIITKVVELKLNWNIEQKRIKKDQLNKKNEEIEETYYTYLDKIETFYSIFDEISKLEEHIYINYDVLFNIKDSIKRQSDYKQTLKELNSQIRILKNKLTFKISSDKSKTNNELLSRLYESTKLIDELTTRFIPNAEYNSVDNQSVENFFSENDSKKRKQKEALDKLNLLLIEYQSKT